MTKSKVLKQNKNYITLKQRIKDKHAKKLLSLAREVNHVFNFVNDLNHQHIKRDMNVANNIFVHWHTHITRGILSIYEEVGVKYE